MTERKAFDTTKYTNQTSLVNDLASLAIESSTDLPLRKRVNPFALEVTNDQRVINPALGQKDVAEYYSEGSELDRMEKEAGVKIRDCLLFEPDGTLSVWISPPGGPLEYEEGRIVVGINKEGEGGAKSLESYGICMDFQSQTCLEIANRLDSYTDVDQPTSNPEDLRSEIFVFVPSDGKPWKFLREQIPLDDVWDSIEYGQAKEMKYQAIQDAQVVSQEIFWSLLVARTEQDYIQVGAYAERHMKEKGWNITSGTCGALNGDLLSNSSKFLQSHVQVGTGGNVVGVRTELGKFVKNCGKCGKEINKVISTGYKCLCGGIYEGC